MANQILNGDNHPTRILVLEAFEHVWRDKCAAYEEAGVRIDNKVRETEPGMLVHALTKVSESPDKTVYRWLEVFDGAAALEAHLDNPAVVEHIAMLNDGILAEPTELVIYADWDEAERARWSVKLKGAKLTFAPVLAGFYLQR